MTDVKIKVTFVIPKHCNDQNDCSEDMLIAYTACENHRGGGLEPHWTREDSLVIDKPLTKIDIFVLSEFEGELYEKLKATKCLVLGPRCLSCSLTEGNTIPSKGHPVYTVAMRGLIVTVSGLAKELKTTLKQKIEWMGGTYSAVLSSETTHLIANNVFSDKYIKATERGIPVMRDTWVDAVWEASLKLDINGSSSEFNGHRLPPFANLQITTSGLSAHDKKLIMKLVNANGGDFSRVFLSQTTDVLVLTKETTSSEKYKAAIDFGKVCVTPHWVKDSAALGFALPISRYKVLSSATTSSPVNNRSVPDMSLNLTRITKDGKPSNFVDESKMTDSIMLSGSTKFQFHQEAKKDVDEIQRAFEAFDVASIKKAGPIFHGFCIWVTGLNGVARDRAWACVSRARGVRYDGPHPRVTHAVARGAAAAAAAAALPAVPVLSPLWLIRSVEAGRVLDEAEFLINPEPTTPHKASQPRMAAASPMSKRTLQLLLPPRDTAATEEPQRDHIVDHYLNQNLSQAAEPKKSPEPVEKPEPVQNEDNTAATITEFTQSENIFKNLVFEVQGLEDEAICEIGAEIREEGGMLVAAGAGGSHVLVPLDFDTSQLVTETAEAVTVFWVKDCLSRQALTPVEYYHRPVHLKSPSAPPLEGVVASLSTYTGVERAFLDELAKLCGAAMQQQFCRRSNNSALASTHLICPEASGAKYAAAVKWGVPVVRAGWLLACAETGVRVDETEYSVDRREATVDKKIETPDSDFGAALRRSTKRMSVGARKLLWEFVSELPTNSPRRRENDSETPASKKAKLTEGQFLINPEPTTPHKASQPRMAAASPMSKRTLQLLLPPRDTAATEEPQRDHIVDHYLNQNLSQAAEPKKSPEPVEKPEPVQNEDNTAATITEFTQSENIFKNLVFEVQGLEDEAICEIGAEIREEGGMLVAAGAGGSHVLVPLDFDTSQLVTETAEAVTVFWVKDCLSRQALTPVEYYHRPVHLKSPSAPPLEGVVASLSTYTGVERAFLDELAKLCGAAMQQQFCRRSNNSALASTHLICPEASGAKYAAAVKWGVPVVRAGWLLACAETGVRVDETEYSVDRREATVDKKIETPDSDFGAALRRSTKRMSVGARKLLWEFVSELPTNSPRRRENDSETPASKKAKLTEGQSAGGAAIPEPAPRPPSVVPAEVDEQLQRLNVVLTGRRTPRRASRVALQPDKPESGPESQPNTVGWDDTTPSQKDSFKSIAKPQRVDTVPIAKPDKQLSINQTKTSDKSDAQKKDGKPTHLSKMEVDITDVSKSELKAIENACVQTETKNEEMQKPAKAAIKRFMLSSNVDNREETVEMILRLGGEVTDLDEEEEGNSPPATHLLCCAPARSQRVLSCIACGCWVLHPAYIAWSSAAGVFLPEEGFEWGNPLAVCLPPVAGGERVLALAAHRWRARKQRGLPGPFAGVVALLHAPAPRRRLLATLVKAGEGTVVDEQPPYTDESITVCFVDPKRYPMKERDRAWLVSRRVPVCASILLSAFLTEEDRPDLDMHCLFEF